MQASKLEIEDKSSRLRKMFRGKAPDIGGNNFFTGEYVSNGGLIGINTEDPRDWKLFWTGTLKMPPPGDLPKGALAIMIAEHQPGDPCALVPEKITLNGGDISVDWQRRHTATSENPDGKSRFAVLIVPKASNSQTYRDIFVSDEQRKAAERLAEDLKGFHDGSQGKITLLPITKLKRKMEFMK